MCSSDLTMPWGCAPSQASIPFPALSGKFADRDPRHLHCPHRASGKTDKYPYRNHQCIFLLHLRSLSHLLACSPKLPCVRSSGCVHSFYLSSAAASDMKINMVKLFVSPHIRHDFLCGSFFLK